MVTRTIRVIALAFLALNIGCGQPDSTETAATGGESNNASTEHPDPHDVPLTDAEIDQLREDTASWDSAIQHVQEYRDTIKTETTGGTPAKAHRALDLLDYVLQWLPEVAQTNNVPKDDWQTIGENSQKLRDAFNAIHANIDDGKAPGYEEFAAEIDAAVDALAAISAGQASDVN